MNRIILTLGSVAVLVFLASCGTVEYTGSSCDTEIDTPEATFHKVITALRTRDVETAKQHTLYGEYVDWRRVMAEVNHKPKKYRIRKILYKDATPQLFNSSMIYYQAADGENYVVEFTRVGDRWYWGTKINRGLAQVLRAKALASREVQKPQE